MLVKHREKHKNQRILQQQQQQQLTRTFAVRNAVLIISKLEQNLATSRVNVLLLQCLDAVGGASGRASGL